VTGDSTEAWPETAEALMRSRFEAFKNGDAEWLLASWHRSTRPESVDLTHNPRWRGLQIVDTVAGRPADDDGIVEFKATYLVSGKVHVMQERSRFVREDGRWYYLDAMEPPT
jgi:SEC-C motif-containing protein